MTTKLKETAEVSSNQAAEIQQLKDDILKEVVDEKTTKNANRLRFLRRAASKRLNQ